MRTLAALSSTAIYIVLLVRTVDCAFEGRWLDALLMLIGAGAWCWFSYKAMREVLP